MKIRKGDNVQVITGKDRGKRGTVSRVIPKDDKVIVDGLNIVKVHRRAKKEGEKGERIEVAAPIHISNVALVCPTEGVPTKVGYRIEGGEKVRFSKRSGKTI